MILHIRTALPVNRIRTWLSEF